MKKYKEVNGTSYNASTSNNLITVLEECRMKGIRIIIDYGDIITGESWGEIKDVVGRLERSTGIQKIPILLYNSRSISGRAIFSHFIVGIKESRGGKILYSSLNNKI